MAAADTPRPSAAFTGDVIRRDVPVTATAVIYDGVGSMILSQQIGSAVGGDGATYAISHSLDYGVLKVSSDRDGESVAVELDLRALIQGVVDLAEKAINQDLSDEGPSRERVAEDPAEPGLPVDEYCTARDRQPFVTDIEALDPVRWLGDETVPDFALDLVDRHTRHAGRALFAVKAFAHRLSKQARMEGLRDPARLVPDTILVYEAARDAVAAYAQLAASAAGPNELASLVQDLCSDLHHLADAKGVALDDSPSPGLPATALRNLMGGLIEQLRAVCPEWARRLRVDPSGPFDPYHLDDFDLLYATAHKRYCEDITPTDA